MPNKPSLIKNLFWAIEDVRWSIRCRYNLWLHGPYGLAKVIENIPFRFLIKYLRKYGAKIGTNCRFERGTNLHRPLGKKPFENLIIGDNVYLGHNTLIDLSRKVTLKDRVIIASRCQIWTHASYYANPDILDPQYGEHFGAVTIEEGALIYSGVVISHGIAIGKFARVGANSLVIKDVEENGFVGGVPAKIIRC
jgi:acetyltransferase-like isoleucine patch superfamily enzyme